MGAITIGLMSVLKAKDHILIPDSVYGSARRFIQEEFPRLNIEFEFYNSRDLDHLEALVKKNTKVQTLFIKFKPLLRKCRIIQNTKMFYLMFMITLKIKYLLLEKKG